MNENHVIHSSICKKILYLLKKFSPSSWLF